jgi:dihydroorotate dehydrogenase (fumarate)
VLKSIFEEEINFEYNEYAKEAEKYGYDYEYLDYFDYKIKQDNINKYINLIKEAKANLSIPVIASVNCISSHEWTSFAKRIEEAGADALELNIFIMPSDINKTSSELEETYFNIVKEVRSKVQIPLIVKMTQYFTGLANVIINLSKLGIDGIVLFNRHYHLDFDIDKREIRASHVFSEETEYILPLRWIAITSGKVECSLAASTGVHDGRSLVKMILAGASAVEVVSTIYKHGPQRIQIMNQFLTEYMEKHGYNTIDDFRGLMSQDKVKNPAMFERVQFMRYFSDREDIL